jgi:hypothetical protein
VESPPSHAAPVTSALPFDSSLHSSRTAFGGYVHPAKQQQQLLHKTSAPLPVHSISTHSDAPLVTVGGDSGNGFESIVASEAAADCAPPTVPAAIFWNVSAFASPPQTRSGSVITTLRDCMSAHLQLHAALPVFVTGCCGSEPDSDIATVATTALLDCTTSNEAGRCLASELLLWCCHNPRSYVLVACTSRDVLRACRRLAMCGHRVVLAYLGSSINVGNAHLIEWNALCSGLAELPPPPNVALPASSPENDDVDLIRSIHSILIDAPLSGFTVAELHDAYAHNRSLLPTSSPLPLDCSLLGYNNFLELLLCNCGYFVVQWDSASSEVSASTFRLLFYCSRR